MITKFTNRTELMEFCVDIDNELKAIGNQMGVRLTRKSGKYDDGSFTFQVEARIPGVATLKDQMLPTYMSMHGLTKTVAANGYQLTGYNSRRPKYPWDGIDPEGRRRKMPMAFVKKLFA